MSIGDGDTIRVRQDGRAMTVRLACIDAPETVQSPWGQQTRRYVQRRLPIGRQVTLNVQSTDRYGRTMAKVVADININLALMEDGQEFAHRQYLGGCDAKAYFRRGRRYHCTKIGSCAQAQHLLAQGHSYLDGDGDGQACEALR